MDKKLLRERSDLYDTLNNLMRKLRVKEAERLSLINESEKVYEKINRINKRLNNGEI